VTQTAHKDCLEKFIEAIRSDRRGGEPLTGLALEAAPGDWLPAC
jgi:hypothetical protein